MSFSSHLTSSSDITYQSTHHGTDEKPKKRQICENKERKDSSIEADLHFKIYPKDESRRLFK